MNSASVNASKYLYFVFVALLASVSAGGGVLDNMTFLVASCDVAGVSAPGGRIWLCFGFDFAFSGHVRSGVFCNLSFSGESTSGCLLLDLLRCGDVFLGDDLRLGLGDRRLGGPLDSTRLSRP
jgi:hypothetical protein